MLQDGQYENVDYGIGKAPGNSGAADSAGGVIGQWILRATLKVDPTREILKPASGRLRIGHAEPRLQRRISTRYSVAAVG
jgi:hypothetical protein